MNLRSQCRGRGFNSPPLHFVLNKPFDEHVEGLFYFRDESCVVGGNSKTEVP